ncbi:ATP synthase subunit I [Thalassobacillus pellis]|uniref:ATP synthase subunit I n=1 Tax=Thalassobacillus pellis TaxID=748008 RepID=UPI00195F2D43|nr:ATP synthase subunit I [Thalassobacillus pellis]MBM7551766.1 ATP synthase protein I [Thalassobacillus pellis]
MQRYHLMITRQRKWMFYLLATFVLGWGFTDYKTIFLGILLGSVFSFINLLQMQRKIRKSIDHAGSDQRKSYKLGTFSRLASAGLAVLIALQFNEYFHIIGVVIGLMTIYVVIIIDFLLFDSRNQYMEEG